MTKQAKANDGTYFKQGADGSLHIFEGLNDRTQEMLERATQVQMKEQILADVATEAMFSFSNLVTDELNARGAGVLSVPRNALLCGVSLDAVATAMPRVKLHHPAHTTLQ